MSTTLIIATLVVGGALLIGIGLLLLGACSLETHDDFWDEEASDVG